MTHNVKPGPVASAASAALRSACEGTIYVEVMSEIAETDDGDAELDSEEWFEEDSESWTDPG